MAEFHINSAGVPAPCKATKGNCPFGDANSHYDTKEEAQEVANRINEERFNLLPKSGISPETQKDFMDNVYYPAHMTEKIDFVVRMDQLDYDGVLDDAENSESIKKVFTDNFNEDALVYEIENDDPLSYSLNSLSDGVYSVYDDIGNKLESEGLDVSLVHGEDDYNENFEKSYREYLNSKQGPVKEVFGRKLAEIEDPYKEDTEQFFRDYIVRHGAPTNTNVSPEVQKDFNENAYYPSQEASLNSYVQRMDMLDEDDFINESDNPEAIKEVFRNNFNKDALVLEVEANPLNHTLYSLDDGIVESYRDLEVDLMNEGYTISSIVDEDGDYTEGFKDKYKDYLASKQGPVKELFGRKLAEVEDPASKSTKQFFIDYIKRNG